MDKLDLWIKRICNFVGSVALVSMICIIALNCFLRFFASSSIKWSEEVGYILFCYAVFIGTVLNYENKELISINAVLIMLPKKVQNVIFYLKRFAMIIINAVLLYLAFLFTRQGAVKETALMRISYVYIDASIMFMFFFMLLLSIKDFIYAVQKKDVVDSTRKTE